MYRKQVLHHLLLAKRDEDVVAFAKKLNLKDCSYMLADAQETYIRQFAKWMENLWPTKEDQIEENPARNERGEKMF